ncbi:hypothetical protein [Paenibacillus sp. ISL-20]|uniref:hypothetical protein n=1 Tax=Paenibacillus sp. ISL-20 TaxID=2819163 RepID=UPI001BEB9B8C|nr:hypothetical protein [Paenibacillus sp. ISL-20]MBT2764297.1 hypothetical protein [Paenibacillus sp. ISL-20]
MEIDFTKYLPVAAAILSATLGYMFGSRTKKNDRLIQFTQENLKEVFSPMYHEMQKIIADSVKPKDRESMLDTFFERYIGNDTSIYKLGSLELLDTFYELSDRYGQFKLSRDEGLWKDIWWEFENNLFFKVKEGYRNSTDLLYRDFRWQQYIQAKPYWLKAYFESMRFLFETVKGINVISALLVYFSGCFKLLGLGLFPKDFWIFSLMILGLSVLATFVLRLPNMQYISLTSNSKKNFLRQVAKKVIPALVVKWDNLFIKKDYDKVPKMHEKRFFED